MGSLKRKSPGQPLRSLRGPPRRKPGEPSSPGPPPLCGASPVRSPAASAGGRTVPPI